MIGGVQRRCQESTLWCTHGVLAHGDDATGMIHDIDHVRREVQRIAQTVGASGAQLPAFARPDETARPYILVDDASYYYIIEERGVELERLTTDSLDELLYRACCDMTFSLAVAYELRHRVPGQDSRRIMFDHQVELLGRVDGVWAVRQAHEHARILARHPFVDGR